MNDFTNCYRCSNGDIMMLYISAMDNARKLKFSRYVHLPYVNKLFQYSIGEAIIFEHGCYISALEHVGMLVLSNYVLLACINAIYKFGHAWVI